MHSLAISPADDGRTPAYTIEPAASADAGVKMQYDRDEEVFGEGEATRYVYRVISGAVRTYRVLADGRRQIVEFYLDGDTFGLDGDAHHTMSAEAVTGTTLMVMRRASFVKEGEGGGAVAALLTQFQRAQAHILMLGRQTACEKVCAFLLDLRARLGGGVFDLPMSRQDMADYLGLTIETVSRTFTQLQASKLIDLTSCRHVHLRNVPALERTCQ